MWKRMHGKFYKMIAYKLFAPIKTPKKKKGKHEKDDDFVISNN